MIIKKCQHCGADIKLKKELKTNIGLSCDKCLHIKLLEYRYNDPRSPLFISRVLDKLDRKGLLQ